ncbi:MAG: alpha-galactosidase [Clostridia bacterium]
MNIRDYTLKVSYKCDGKVVSVTENDSVLTFLCNVNYKGTNIVVNSKKKVELLSAEIIYDRYFENNERIFCNGYQSWTTSREYKKGDTQYGLRNVAHLPLIRKFASPCGDYDFAQYGRDLFHSHSYTYFNNNDGGLDFFGSLDDRNGYTIFYSDVRENVFAILKDVEGLVFEGDYKLFDIAYFAGSYETVFDRYFAVLPQKNTGRVDRLVGYTSWYNYYQNINEEIILRDLKGLSLVGSDANIFQIDDGYETMIGDWEVDKKKFPNGMKPIVDAIKAKKLQAGLWVAPFSAEFKAKIVQEHPDWFLRKANGKMLTGGVAWGGFYVLDIENPDVRAYIKAYFNKVFDEWGFDMVKLDFLYSACIMPRNGKTRGQLMYEAMDFLRECCGEKLILGCGVPLMPAFGKVDACRIGCDVEFSFKDRFYTKLTNQEIVSAKMAINNSIFRRHLNKRIFANDTDVFFLRDDGAKPAKFNLEQKKLLAKINHMCGDVLFVSDNIGAYDNVKMAILLETYKRFDGKIVDAEYVEGDTIALTYVENGKKNVLTFNTITGENNTVKTAK